MTSRGKGNAHSLPAPIRAIYGNAAVEHLKSTGVYDVVKPKLLIIATVPQIASYIIADEVDYSLINLTHARKIEKTSPATSWSMKQPTLQYKLSLDNLKHH